MRQLHQSHSRCSGSLANTLAVHYLGNEDNQCGEPATFVSCVTRNCRAWSLDAKADLPASMPCTAYATAEAL